MQFQKGKEKTGGRTKGTPNKLTSKMRNRIKRMAAFCEENMEEDIKGLAPGERLRIWIAMQPYLTPKLNAEKVVNEADNELQKIELTQKIVYRAVTEEEIETGAWKNE